jgi:hypothetical protein
MSDIPESLPQTCDRCGENLITGVLKGTGGKLEQACMNCDPGHLLSVAVRDSLAQRDPLITDKATIEIYGHDLPATEVWTAVSRFIHETFNADWSVDLKVEDDQPDDLA